MEWEKKQQFKELRERDENMNIIVNAPILRR